MCQKRLEGRLSKDIGLHGVMLKCKNTHVINTAKKQNVSPNLTAIIQESGYLIIKTHNKHQDIMGRGEEYCSKKS